MMQLDQASLGMPGRDYFLRGRDDKTLSTYQDLAINVAIALGASPETAKREMTDMIDFEIKLANVSSYMWL